MKPQAFDLIVIGGGSGGLAGAFRAASHGARVALLEPKELGGTCVNVGCVPKKAMWLVAELSQKIALASSLGFDTVPPTLDWKEFIVHRQRYIAGIHASYLKRLDESGVVLMPCRGRLLDANTVVNADGVRLGAEHLLIATGGHPVRPAIPGAALGKVSDDFFNLCAAPGRVAIIGGGYVAVELAGVLQALGSQVEMFVRGQRLLDGFDTQITDELAADMRQHGVRVQFGHAVAALERAPREGVVLLAEDGSRTERFDGVIFATGRRATTRDMGLESAGVTLDAKGFVQVDERQDTRVAGIHAVGDVTGQAALTPVAIAAARRLMDRLFGGQADARLDYTQIPTVVFSHPPVGRVGLTEAEARERHGDAVTVLTARFRPMLHALADTPQRSLFKLVLVGEDKRVVGLHLLGEGVDEMLQGFAVALKKGITLADLHDTVALHPTSAEEVVLMR
ncbi:glutathione-disulfide reductase [Pseudoxanthomonas sp.]|uniref:glutathione-disulfide reductase n=1 Tax=Pseudoxanthomonas sp. TaxID=1871049 RepID=UPI002FE3EEF1